MDRIAQPSEVISAKIMTPLNRAKSEDTLISAKKVVR
jgi:hypothetical protein